MVVSSCKLQKTFSSLALPMAALRTFFFSAFFTTTIPILLSSTPISAVDFNYPAIFNFGDSNSDTGALVSAGFGESLDPPNGENYFHKPSGRFCDGRLIIDFLSNLFPALLIIYVNFLCSPYEYYRNLVFFYYFLIIYINLVRSWKTLYIQWVVNLLHF